MTDPVQAQREASLLLVDDLIRRGRQIRGAPTPDVIRPWQRDCAAAINQLSGGSKAHWLARAYSTAFLVRATDGGVVVEASASEIVDRILDVLVQAKSSLSGMESIAPPAPPASTLRRFEFVHSTQLRPILAEAFAEGSRALDEGDLQAAFNTLCGILETIITDALEHKGLNVSDWPFAARIEEAQRAGLIAGSCARLPAVARRYRELAEGEEQASEVAISERDARVVRQVLLVVMRDLDPGDRARRLAVGGWWLVPYCAGGSRAVVRRKDFVQARMNQSLAQFLHDLYADGVAHDEAQPDRLLKRRNLEPDSAGLLSLVVRIAGARAVVEIGTSNGYSTIWLADAVGDTGGRVVSVDIGAADEARANLAMADSLQTGLAGRVELRQEDGGAYLATLGDSSVDLLFMDAERVEYMGWWPHPVRAIRPGGLLVLDNVLSHADEVASFLARLADDFVGATVAVGKGLHLAWRRGGLPAG